jgi:hypothetical protein
MTFWDWFFFGVGAILTILALISIIPDSWLGE